jgi:hypothetical protein
MLKWLIPIIEVILRALIPALAKLAQPTAEDSRPQPELRKSLQARVRQAGWCVVLGLAFMSGCQPRTIYVPSGEPVRLRETIKNAKVWVKDSDGNAVAGEMDLPEGWYALPVDDEE